MEENNLSNLRSFVKNCFEKSLYDSAVFYAHKLVILSQEDPVDVITLAQSYYFTKQYRRALHLLMKEFESLRENPALINTITSSQQLAKDKYIVKAAFLAAKCAAALESWEECMQILTCVENKDSQEQDEGIKLSATLCQLRGEACIALENRSRAGYWFQQALIIDTRCYEPFECLLKYNMLSASEATELLNKLQFSPEFLWLKSLYEAQLKKFNITKSSELLHTLSNELVPADLRKDPYIQTAQAEMCFYRNEFMKCYEITKRILDSDPHLRGPILTLHISTLVELKLKNELYFIAHRLVDESPSEAISWYGVGSHYFLIGNYELARKYFSKCTGIDSHFGYGWLGFGHSFAGVGEHDQAMAAYRTASRIMPGCHLPLLCIGMELIRINNFTSANQNILQAKALCPSDPLIYNELGVIFYRNKQYEKAVVLFQQALQLSNSTTTFNDERETTFFNLAQCYRKIRQYDNALKYYQEALNINPTEGSIHSAIGFTNQLLGNTDVAIENYHRALGLKPEDPFPVEMLNRCFESIHFE